MNLAGQLEKVPIEPLPAPWDTFTFLIIEDGVERTETVRLDFADIPSEVMARIVHESDMSDVDDIAAAVLAYRLDVPKAAAVNAVAQWRRGGGVVDGR